MAERPRPDAELSGAGPGDGDEAPRPEAGDDDLVEALAAVFGTSPPAAGWNEWSPDPYPDAPLPAIEPPLAWAAPRDAPEPDMWLADPLPEPPAGQEVVPDLRLPAPPPLPPVIDSPPADLALPETGEAADPVGPASPDFDLEPEPGASTGALQEAGFGSPLHSALSELRRIIPESRDGEESEEPSGAPAVAASGPATPDPAPHRAAQGSRGLSLAALREQWALRWRERTPGLIVAAVVVLAFAVVLATGDRDEDSRVDTGRSTPATAPPTTLGASLEPTIPPDLPIGEGDPAVSADVGVSAPSGLAPARRRFAVRQPAPARAPARAAPAPSGRGRAPSPSPLAPAPQNPPADNPPVNNPPEPPPQTTPTTSPDTTIPDDNEPRDPCAAIPDPERRADCQDILNR